MLLDRAIELLEKANADLDPELLPAATARRLLARYARIEKLGAFGVTALARKVSDAAQIAKVTGASMGKAQEVVATAEVLSTSGELDAAMRSGRVSGQQAAVIASAERSAPGSAAARSQGGASETS